MRKKVWVVLIALTIAFLSVSVAAVNRALANDGNNDGNYGSQIIQEGNKTIITGAGHTAVIELVNSTENGDIILVTIDDVTHCFRTWLDGTVCCEVIW